MDRTARQTSNRQLGAASQELQGIAPRSSVIVRDDLDEIANRPAIHVESVVGFERLGESCEDSIVNINQNRSAATGRLTLR
jgi:hypothetical protein